MTQLRSALVAAASLLIALAIMPADLAAQDQPATAQQQNSSVTDTHVSGSWSVRCYKVGTMACDLTQASFMRNKNLRVASIAIGYIPKSDQYIGRFVVPLGVSFSDGLTIEIGAFRAPGLKYRRCERDGCYVEGILPQAMLDAMQNSGSAKGAMNIVSVDGRKLQIPIALDGFSDGLSLLKEWTSQKVSAKK